MTQDILKKREIYGRRSGVIGLLINICLAAIKLFVGLFSGSVAVIADSINNLTDAANSIITLVGFKLASKPADKEHPFGHGRTEDIAGLIIAVSIIIFGIEFIRSSIESIINPPEMSFSILSVALLFVGIVAKFWMYIYNKKMGSEINSEMLLAIAKDSRNDCIITFSTIISLVVTAYFGIHIDGFVGIFISIILLRTGFMSAKSILSNIMGRPVDKKTADAIVRIVMQQDEIIGVHDLMVHNYGPGRNVATLHAEVPMDMTVAIAHNAIDAAEADVMAQLGVALTIHLDPVDIDNKELNHIKYIVRSYLDADCPEADAHDFRFAQYSHGHELVFELQFPHGTKEVEREKFVAGAKGQIHEIYPDCDVIINVEFGFVADE